MFRLMALLGGMLLSSALLAQSLPQPVLTALQKGRVPPEALGVYVQEVAAPGSTAPALIRWQAELPLQPASTMKLVTSYAALDMLGPAYSWKTSVYLNGSLDGDVLHGDLIVQGGGDPHLLAENFWQLLHQIRAQGIRDITGNLILDNSWMQPQSMDAAEFDHDPTRPYNVGPDALLVNFNVLNLHLHEQGESLSLTPVTPVALQTSVQVSLGKGSCSAWRDGLQPQFSLIDQQIHLQLSGTYPRGCGDQSWMLQPYPLTPQEVTGALFRQLWQEAGGQLEGAIVAGSVPTTAVVVTEMSSLPLPEILRAMNKHSNNVMTRLVMLTLDHQARQAPASAAAAATLVQNWFARLGIDTQGLLIENGSGLSRSERISALQLGSMLKHAYASSVMPELLASMPVLGVDGTMKNRALNQPVAGHAHMKSGSLEGVRAIAGYVLAASGKRYVVVCLLNHPNASQGVSAQDVLLQWVYANG